MNDFKIVVGDAGETVVVQRSALNAVEKTVTERIRPSKFRRILQIDSSHPSYLDGAEFDIVESSAQWVASNDHTEDFVTATTKIGKGQIKFYELISGYRYTNRELVRAKSLGISLDTARASAVMKKAESVLDHIAANGTTDGTKPLGTNTTGLYNHPGKTPVVISATSTAYEDLDYDTADNKDAFVETMVSDALALEDSVEAAALETGEMDTIVYPLSLRPMLNRANRAGKTVKQMILDRASYIKRIEFWVKGQTLGAGGLRRIVGCNGADLDAARFVMPKSPTPGRAQQTMNGVAVPVTMVVGGFSTKLPETLVYADSAAPS